MLVTDDPRTYPTTDQARFRRRTRRAAGARGRSAAGTGPARVLPGHRCIDALRVARTESLFNASKVDGSYLDQAYLDTLPATMKQRRRCCRPAAPIHFCAMSCVGRRRAIAVALIVLHDDRRTCRRPDISAVAIDAAIAPLREALPARLRDRFPADTRRDLATDHRRTGPFAAARRRRCCSHCSCCCASCSISCCRC